MMYIDLWKFFDRQRFCIYNLFAMTRGNNFDG